MIQITNQTKYPIPRKLILNVLKQAVAHLKIKPAQLSIVFVNQSTIKKLNSNYRHKNQATDVLSFNYTQPKKNLDGEIIICYPVLKANAVKYGNSFNQELTKILIHSLLHLLGHTHAKNKDAELMQSLENKIIQSLKI